MVYFQHSKLQLQVYQHISIVCITYSHIPFYSSGHGHHPTTSQGSGAFSGRWNETAIIPSIFFRKIRLRKPWFRRINTEALCAAPPEALAHSPSLMPLSCLVAPLSQRELHKDGGGSGGGEARRPGTEGQFLRHVQWNVLCNALRNALSRVLDVLVLHVSPKESMGSGGR